MGFLLPISFWHFVARLDMDSYPHSEKEYRNSTLSEKIAVRFVMVKDGLSS